MAETAAADDFEIRPPKQRRSREAWNRVLDTGVELLEDGGYEAFTIAAVCDRAGVAPPAIYARTSTKDALFLAVYEHGIARLRAEQEVFTDGDHWAGLEPDALVRSAVAEMIGISLRHTRFLRAVVLTSAAHPEVQRRGSRHSRELGERFATVLRPLAGRITHADPEAAIWSSFETLFAASMIRVAYGSGFATPVPVDDHRFVVDMGETAVRYLLGGECARAGTSLPASRSQRSPLGRTTSKVPTANGGDLTCDGMRLTECG